MGFDILKQTSSSNTSRVTQRDIRPSAVVDRLLKRVYTKEVWLQGHPQWDNSWNNLSTYENVIGSINYINFDDFPDHEFYFEMIGLTDAGTGYWRLYNQTDDEEIENSELSTTSTSAVRLRTDSLVKPSGTKEIIIQHKIVGGGGSDYVNSIMSRFVFRLP